MVFFFYYFKQLLCLCFLDFWGFFACTGLIVPVESFYLASSHLIFIILKLGMQKTTQGFWYLSKSVRHL